MQRAFPLNWSGVSRHALCAGLFVLASLLSIPAFAANILLVDDDDAHPSNSQSAFIDALNSLGLVQGTDYDVINTANSTNEPNLTTLSGYQTVIWFSADSFDSAGPEPGIPGTGEDALEDYLDGGGCLFLTAKDYAWDKDTAPATGGPYTVLTSLMSGYLGVSAGTHDITATNVTGANLFAGYGPYALQTPESNYSDALVPDGTAVSGLTWTSGNAGIYKDSGTYRTVFWPFGFEAISSSQNRTEAMQNVLEFCDTGTVSPPDADGDGVADTLDNCPVDANANQLDDDSDGRGNACEVKSILLVDDDGGVPPVRANFEAALQTAGYTNYTVHDKDNQGNPTAAELDGYDTVIWFTGDDDSGSGVGPNAQGETDLDGFLQSENGCLLMFSDAMPTQVSSSFLTDTLGIISSGTSLNTVSSIKGIGPASGMNSFAMDFAAPGMTEEAQTVNVDAAATAIFEVGSGEAIGVQKNGSTWQSVTLSTHFSAIEGAAIRAAFMGASLGYCKTGTWVRPLIDLDGDGIDDSIDNCPDVANADQLDDDSDGIGNVCEVQSILLVDDSTSSPDVLADFEAALQAVGETSYTVHDTSVSGDPTDLELDNYDAVIWFTGDDSGPSVGPGGGSEFDLQNFVQAQNGCLLMFSRDVPKQADDSFLIATLGIQPATSSLVSPDPILTTATGPASVMGTYEVDYPASGLSQSARSFYIDDPYAEAIFLESSGPEIIGVQVNTPANGRTMTLGMQFSAIAGADKRAEIMGAALNYCAAGTWTPLPADTDNDGIDNSIDNCPTDYNPNQADDDADGQGNICDKPSILLVNDDEGSPDESALYSTALDDAGYSGYTLHDATQGGNSDPDLTTLLEHEVIIWFTGDDTSSSVGPDFTAAIDLEQALQQQGSCLVMLSRDYPWVADSNFRQNTLGIQDSGNWANIFSMDGVGPASSLGTFGLIEPSGVDSNARTLTPYGTGTTVFENGGQAVGIQSEGGSWRAMTLTVPFSAIDDRFVRAGLMSSIVGYCETGTWESPDLDEDGVTSPQDNCPLAFNPDQTDTDTDGRGDVCDATILLVDDDEETPDVLAYYTDALNDADHGDFSLYDASALSDPDLATLSAHDVIIWFTGDDSANNNSGPGSTGQNDLELALNGSSSCLAMLSRDFVNDGVQTSLQTDVLGISGAGGLTTSATMEGTGTASTIGPYALSFLASFTDEAARPHTADVSGTAVFTGDGGADVYGIEKQDPAWRAFTLGIPFSGITDRQDRAGFMRVILNYCETGGWAEPDFDGDGIIDADDNCPFNANASQLDFNGDGRGDACDLDDDNDGVPDATDTFPLDNFEWIDTDADGIGNNADTDDDGDSVLDVADSCPLGDTGWTSSPATDNDGDGCRDTTEDTDDDNDGVLDGIDFDSLNPLSCSDTDADQCDDCSIGVDGFGPLPDGLPLNDGTDTDSDGACDVGDTDDDNDGTPDELDAFPLDPAEDTDTDNDGVGNNADPDDDNDGIPDISDAFPLDPTESVDTDSDGIGNNADSDDDNDGEPDVTDVFPLDPTETADNDGDGIGDNADIDDDNDGLMDTIEDANSNGVLDPGETNPLAADTDGDGQLDPAEVWFGSDPQDAGSTFTSPALVSIHSSGLVANERSLRPDLTSQGELVVFNSKAFNLVLPDPDSNNAYDAFVKDMTTGVVTLASTASTGGQQSQSGRDSGLRISSISADGRYVVWSTLAAIWPYNGFGGEQIYRKDRQTGETVIVSTGEFGGGGNNDSIGPVLSDDGNLLALQSDSTNLINGNPTQERFNIFLKNMSSNAVFLVSADASGVEGNDESFLPDINADGRYVAFYSLATNLVSGDTNATYDVFRKDTQSSAIVRVSTSSAGAQGNNGGVGASVSDNGRYVGFESSSTNLVEGDGNGWTDVFIKDIQTGETVLISKSADGTQSNNSSTETNISGDGRFVVFSSNADNLDPSDSNSLLDVYIVDTLTRGIRVVSVDTAGVPPSGVSDQPAISADGRYIVFRTWGSLVSEDTNSRQDIYRAINPFYSEDSDADGLVDVLDTDNDNDGISDQSDTCPLDAAAAQSDFDGDGMGDACDDDDDNDGTPDATDVFPFDPAESMDFDGDGIGDNADTDDDNDGIPDTSDNCPFLASPDQTDTDGDGLGNVCDDDDDNDGEPDVTDVFPTDPTETADNDGDGIGDNADTDDDNDGIPDTSDNCPFLASPDLTDTDGDGMGNVCDDDDDNDGVEDGTDAEPLNPGVCGDTDRDHCDDCAVGVDGFGPAVDSDWQNDGPDNDGDNVCDLGDLDDDNDGLLDQYERLYGFDPMTFDSESSLETDPDGDGISTLIEALTFSNPLDNGALPGSVEIAQVKLLPSDPSAGDHFGASVAIDGDTAVVGAPAPGSGHGAVYVFERDVNGDWNETAKLLANDSTIGNQFGFSVAIHSEIIVVGAPKANGVQDLTGGAYIFERDGQGVWSQTAKLKYFLLGPDDEVGYSVATYDGLVVIGAPGEPATTNFESYSFEGFAVAYEKDVNGLWDSIIVFLDNYPEYDPNNPLLYNNRYGHSVAIAGNQVMIGSPRTAPVNQFIIGAVEGVIRANGTWINNLDAFDPDLNSGAAFGESIALASDLLRKTAFFGVPGYAVSGVGDDAGRISVYTNNAGWDALAITAPDATADARFGGSVALDWTSGLVGAMDDSLGEDTGAVYLYRNSSMGTQQWNPVLKILPTEGAPNLKYGHSLAIRDGIALIGAIGEQTNGTNAGAVYVIDLDDFDGDGVFNGSDNCMMLSNPGQVDTDSDQLGDDCDAFPSDSSEWLDSDLDGIGNNADTDDDNDGTPDGSDTYPYDPAETVDTDGDGVGDNGDAFPADPNEWLDTDGDGIGDNADTDIDGDGFNNASDNCPLIDNASQLDTDGDLQGDACDIDDDGDGVVDSGDNCPLIANIDQVDTDTDGLGNVCDLDNDGDGINDDSDNCLLAANGIQEDFDGDGLGDACDSDTDGDGIPDSVENDAAFDPSDVLDPLNAADAQATNPGTGNTFLDDFRAPSNTGQYILERMLPTLEQPWYFDTIEDIATYSDQFVYVSSGNPGRITKLTSDGRFVSTFDPNPNPLMPRAAGPITVDEEGFVYELDTTNNVVRKFTPDGDFVMQLGELGSGPGQFESPVDIEADKSSNIFVLDSSKRTVQAFNTSDGIFLLEFGGVWLNGPTKLTVDNRGNVFVWDPPLNRIYQAKVHASYYVWQSSVISETVWGYINVNSDIVLDPWENLYLDTYSAASNTYSVLKYSISDPSTVVDSWVMSEPVAFHWRSAAFNHRLFVAAHGGTQIDGFSASGDKASSWRPRGDEPGRFTFPAWVFTDETGEVNVIGDGFDNGASTNIQQLSESGGFIDSWSLGATAAANLKDVAYGQNGLVFVADGSSVRKLTRDGTQLADYPIASGNVAGDGVGHLFAIVGNSISMYTTEGVFLQTLGAIYLSAPVDLAADGSGHIYVVDGTSVIVLSSSDQLVSQFTLDPSSGDPERIEVDAYGYIFVSDINNAVITKYSPDGQLMGIIGGSGNSPGRFTSEAVGTVNNFDLMFDIGPNGKLYVTDAMTHRLQIFQPVLQPTNAKAILVAGGGPYPGNHLWNATQAMVNTANRTLALQGFTKDDIYYLSANTGLDLDANGLADDVDADATKANLQYAIETWAADADSLIVYMVDHGGSLTFRMSANETLTDSELSGWLATLEPAIDTTVIYDACLSGSFSPIANPNRIVITSTGPSEVAYFTGQGLLSFSNYFWNGILNGSSIRDAFTAAQTSLSSSPTPQTPQIDADGDGVTNSASDLTAVQNRFIGNGTENFLDAPIISSVSPSQSIDGTSTATIGAFNVTDADGVNRVWAVIHAPDAPVPDPENPVVDLPTVDLTENPAGSRNYSVTYPGFTSAGVYQLSISATDGLGNTSPPKITSITVGSPLSRRAVLVVAGEDTDSDWSSRQAMGTTVYEALRTQGYVDSDITFLSASTVNGVEQLNTTGNLAAALTDAGVLNNTQDLTLYMIGSSDGSAFTLNGSETVPAATLDAWLNPLVNSIPGKLMVIMDADNAGFYLERLDLTATSGGENFYRLASTISGTAHAEGNGSVSYTQFFAGNVANGATVPVAHLLAKQAMRVTSNGQQQAWLDSNSDDTSDKFDISRILNYSLGPGILLAGDDPVIGSAGVDGFVASADPMTITLWADSITTTGTLFEVYALVTPPDTDGFGGTEPQPVKVLLTDTGTRYESAYNLPAPLGGTYNITFYAEDTDGAVSLPLTETLTRKDAFEVDDSEGQANAIIVDAPSQYHSFHDVNDEDWVTFAATAGVTYTITADPVGAEADVVLFVKDPGGSPTTIDDLPAGDHPLGAEAYIFTAASTGAYTVKVSLDNTVTPPNEPSDYTLAVTTDGGGSGTTSVAGQVRDTSGNPVLLAFVKITGSGGTTGTASTFSVNPNGDYSIGDDPGSYSITAAKAGYFTTAAATVWISQDGDGTTIHNITIAQDAAADTDGDGILDVDDPDPNSVDADGDGLVDGVDGVVSVATYPSGIDKNNDGFVDGEADIGTDPTLWDTDGDGFNDGVEVTYDSDPLTSTDTPANGDINEDGVVNIVDVLLATRFVLGNATPTVDEMMRADVAPFNGSYPVPNGILNGGDLVRIERMALGF